MNEDKAIELDDGKYKVVLKDDGCIYVYRYDEFWRDCTGDNLIYWLAATLDKELSSHGE